MSAPDRYWVDLDGDSYEIVDRAFTRKRNDWRGVARTNDPELAQRIVDLLNEEEDVKALARSGAFSEDKENPHG